MMAPPCTTTAPRTLCPPDLCIQPKMPRALRSLLDSPLMADRPAPRLAPIDPQDPEVAPPFPCKRALCAPPNGVYTDGSCIKTNGRQLVGAAIYISRHHITLRINPKGRTYTNTINRAELSAILHALTHHEVGDPWEELHIYTDSLCSIYMIRRILDTPWTLRESKHYDLLRRILDALHTRAQAGGHTHIYKVKSHNGVEGNEKADTGAKKAALEPDSCTIVEGADNDPYSKRPWACIAPTTTTDTDGPLPPPNFLPSLKDGVKRAITPLISGGMATKGFYAEAWEKAVPGMHKPSNARMWKDSSLKWRQVIRTLKARWGQLWNQRLAHRYGMAPTPNCPLCGCIDSVGHMLGGCEHPTARAMKISRHDGAVKLIQQAISKSPKGGWYTVMDAGKDSDLPDDVTGKRLPDWLLDLAGANHPTDHPESQRRRKLDRKSVV